MRRALALTICIVLAGCGSRVGFTPAPAAVLVAETESILVGTNRARTPMGQFGYARDASLRFLELDVTVPPRREAGTVPSGARDPDPLRDFTIAEIAALRGLEGFRAALDRRLASKATGGEEVLVFVHGYNSSLSESAFRLAQIRNDLELPAVPVLFSWPSRATPLGYEYDDDSAHYSRDALELFLREGLARPGGQRLVLIGHSMGAYLLMETLRQIERLDSGWTARNATGVVLISPDIDVDVFRSQLAAFGTVPDPFIVIISRRDRVLDLSALLTGQPERLGNLESTRTVSDLPISLVDVTAFSGGGANHFVAASSPALIALFRGQRELERRFLRGGQGGPPGGRTVENLAEFVLLPLPR